MEQPPGSLDDLQPPDVAASNIPAVIDLTRKGEDCVLNSTSLNALRMVKTPGWYPNSGTTNPGLPLPETGSTDVALQSADQIQPDNAFSRTTVTLSYVSRSHVFSTNDPLSQHSPLYSVPPLSRFSLHPHCDAADRVGEAVRPQNQHYSDPVNLPPHPDPLCPSSQAHGGPGKDPLGCNGGFVSSAEKTPLRVEEELSAPLANSRGLENGECDGCLSPETPQTPTAAEEEEEEEGSEVLFIMSKQQDSVVVPGSAGVDLCSLTREFRSPLEDPVSPSATSLGDVEDVFVLPQASSSPSAGHSYLETSEEQEGAPQPSPDISDANERPPSEPSLDAAEDARGPDASENQTKSVVPHVNGNAEASERKLPMRSGRGMRLEAIVMNINSSRYNVSGRILANKKPSASQSATHASALGCPKRNAAACKRRSKVKTTFSVKTVKRKAKKGKRVCVGTDICKDSTSDSEPPNKAKSSRSSATPKTPRSTRAKREPVQTSTTKAKKRSPSQSSPQFTVQKNSKEDPELLSQPEPTPQSKSPKTKQSKTKRSPSGSRKSPAARTKAARTPKRRRKPAKRCRSSPMFSPKEPEIKLKYASYKEEKKDSRSDAFSPFVRVRRRPSSPPSSCTVINYPEQVKTRHQKRPQQQQAAARDYMSAAVPGTSCLQPGRTSVHGQHRRALVCCLCGQSANAIDLGDLHGPYYPEGYRPSPKTPASASGLKDDEDDYSDSDSSSCSMRGRKRAVPPTSWTLRPGAQLKQKGRLESRRWAGDGPGSPAAKRARSEAGSADAEDWYSPPVLPQEPSEYWLHEDCGIWSAGVFLVKGKVYGLEEAVKVSQETVCSACHDCGATLGCFFKGCPNKYHYRCALDSDCVLIEENFSMKCKKHKNKSFKVPAGSRWDDR